MKYSPVDLTLQQVVPVVAVPLHGDFEPLICNGHRYLVAGNGMFIEARRDWIHLIWPDGDNFRAVKPYGALTKQVTLAFGTLPMWIAERFARDARECGDVEMAAWVIWNNRTRTLAYRVCEPIYATGSKIKYNAPPLREHESLCVDLHSHGYDEAFFSDDDNEDDAAEIKIAGVIGNVNSTPTWKFRLCVMGIYIDVPFHPTPTNATTMDMERQR